MKLWTEPYLSQVERWPKIGKHILAQYDEESIVVYQAYRPDIGRFAAAHGYFGGDFQLGRMSWIKPNFLWMMFRCGWGTKENQETTLAVRIRRSAFDQLLSEAVYSSYNAAVYPTYEDWQQAVKHSNVRMQWDPDHHPAGDKLERRAIQLGLRGNVLAQYAREWSVDIEDISDFVANEREKVQARRYGDLLTPREMVYPVADAVVAQRLGISSVE